MGTAAAEADPKEGFVEVPIRGIEAELKRQLHAEQDEGAPPIQWARMSNLVIYSDCPGGAEQAAREIAAIVRDHPARVLLLLAEPGDGAGGLTARVRVRTRYAHGRQEVGSEQITLHATGHAADKLPGLVRELSIGDLPTNVWWTCELPPPLAGPRLFDLAEDADQVIYDSFGWPAPARGLLAVAPWLDRFERGPGEGRYRVAADLTWRRLKPWRRLIAQALDPAVAPGAIETADAVAIEHGPHSVLPAWSLASWLAQGLGWSVSGAKVQPGVTIDWQFTSPRGPRRMTLRRLADRPRGLHRLRLWCASGGLEVVPDADGRRLAIAPEGPGLATRTVTLPVQPLAELVARQLSDRDRDPAFRRAMAYAQSLARGVLGRG